MSATPAGRIGRYELRGELGRGMMGVVHDAYDTALLRPIALKVIQAPQGASEDELRSYEERFFAEARAAAGLRHPGIVVVHDVGRDPGSGLLFLALERLHGRALDQVLRERGALPWREACDLARKMADALHHAHSRGVVHRDVKPANVMLQESGEPKIMDFGIAKLEASRLTATGQFLGTPLYMSPEQAMAHPVDARADVFALGAVLYEMLTGRAAFAGESVTAILLNVISREPEAPRLVAPDLPPALEGVLARCLAKAREARYADAGALALHLEDVLAGRGPRGQRAWSVPAGGTAIASAPRGAAVAAAAAARTVASASPAAKGAPSGTTRRPQAGPRRRGRSALAGAALVLAASAAFALLRPEPVARRLSAEPPALPSPTPVAEPPSPVEPPAPTSTPAPATPPEHRSPRRAQAGERARVLVDVEHSLRTGVLRVWVDDDQVIERELGARVTKEIVGIKLRKGRLSETLDVKPGRREFRVRVDWDDRSQAGSVRINVQPGETYHVEAKLGSLGGIRKDLSLGWY